MDPEGLGSNNLALTLVNSGTLCYVTSFLCAFILSSVEWVLVSVKHIEEFLTLLVFIIGIDRYVFMGALNIIVKLSFPCNSLAHILVKMAKWS